MHISDPTMLLTNDNTSISVSQQPRKQKQPGK